MVAWITAEQLKGMEELERELAELDALLPEEGITEEREHTVPVEEGIILLKELDAELRPFLIRYTALLNKTRQYIPIEATKLERFILLAERLEGCEEHMLASYGISYLSAINLMVEGVNCNNANINDIEDLVQLLYFLIKLTNDADGTIRLFTYSKSKGSGLYGIAVEKDEDAEE